MPRAKFRVVPGGLSKVVTEDFNRELTCEATKRRVEASIADLCLINGYEVKSWPAVGANTRLDKASHGAVYYVPGKTSRTIAGVVTTAQFPRTIVDAVGLDGRQALQIASDFAYAYAIAVRGQKKVQHRHAYTSNQDPDVWPAEYTTDGNRLVIPYRFAGAVALRGQHDIDGGGLDFALPMPWPAHLAALNNPFDADQAMRFQEVVRKGSVE